jgi:predicted secreted hydrolase
MKHRKIKFPKDELAHNHIIEWWYFNGHLEDKQGNEYSFMNCFFRADVKKVKIPFLTKLPFKILYFSHSAILDIKSEKFYPSIDLISIISKDSFSKPLLFINYINPAVEKGYINCVIEETKKFVYHLKDRNIDLKLTLVKKPLLEAGTGYVDLKSKGTYYYSLTNLKTKGRIKIKNKWIEVAGKSWMDHQWANVSYSKDKWTWFSIQLDNNLEIVCFEYDDGKTKTSLASISYPNNKQEHVDEVKFTPLGVKWTSPKTKAEYPLSWKIKISSKNVDLEVAPLIKSQEMIFGSINYWEGPLKVSGLFDNKKVKGVGFMELVGYPSQYSNIKYVKEELEKAVNQFFSYVKKTTFNIADNIKTRVIK